jgi:hypothetical protein
MVTPGLLPSFVVCLSWVLGIELKMVEEEQKNRKKDRRGIRND